MLSKAFTPFRRTLTLVALALLLPTLLIVVMEISFTLREQRRELQSEHLALATQIQALVDGELQANLSALRALTTSGAAERGDWPRFSERAAEVASLNHGWISVIVSDGRGGRPLVDTAGFIGDGAPAAFARRGGPPTVGDPARDPRVGAYVPMSLPLRADKSLYVTVLIDTDVFQQILAARAGRLPVGAVVDDHGVFVARSVQYDQRVGTPASADLRNAVSHSGPELYAATTVDGLKTYAVFARSAVSGWSTHVALPTQSIDKALAWDNGLRIGGVALSVVVAGGLVALALNELMTRRREEEQLRQAQKMEALGRLTGSVAHDFNNLLTVIIGALDMLSNRLEEPRSKRLADRALEAARRGARLTGQLLTFSRRQRLQVTAVDIGALVAGMDDLLKQSVGATVEVQVAVEGQPLWASTDPNQLEFAILNLAINGRDAMPDGGVLRVEARPAFERGYVEILVRDTGHGMEKSVAERAVEPFFTTKGADRGTGLGLAQVYGTVQQSGGRMRIDSALGRGTVVRLLLPAAEPRPSPPPEAAAVPAPAGRERVLVVDDEADVRAVIVEALTEAGYLVDEAASGETALAALRARPYDLLLTDFAMPGLNGAELTSRARQLKSAQKVLIVSGYADSELVAKVAAPMLAKPVDSVALKAAVRAALAA